ncbi:CBN-SRX-131 protein [Caenorhabditis brenneri]|uniref:CBN-SRX-131 protein n=1 Tax=Caenorhabditis brenneri TaxID=135651 RepID=G0MRQ5_CAEBE|nr:CBN-SRX-131 protein [Caenorhabditis brenneri]
MIMFTQVGAPCIMPTYEMFQSVLQDCLQLIDTFNSYYIWKLYNAVWFQFLFITFSFINVTALDGFVMFLCNSDHHPNWMKGSKPSNPMSRIRVSSPSRHMRDAPFGNISLLGACCDIYLFYKFVTRKSKPSGFQKLCTVKTVANGVICLAFLLWVVPVTSFSFTFTELNHFANRFIGTIAATWAYFLNALLTICISSNRFYALFFPFGIHALLNVSATNWAITVVMFLVSAFALSSLRECADFFLPFTPYIIFTTTFITNCLNLITIIRLLMEKMTGLNVEETKRRRKRWMITYIQSVCQDCLQLIDIINSYYLYLLNEDLWFQFLTVTFSFLTVTAVDGFVMFVCQSDIHPKSMKKMTKIASGRSSIAVVKVSMKNSFH